MSKPLEIGSGAGTPLDGALEQPYQPTLAPANYLEVVESQERQWAVEPREIDRAIAAFAQRMMARGLWLPEADEDLPVAIDNRRWLVVDALMSGSYLAAILQCDSEYLMLDQRCTTHQPWVRFAAAAHGACATTLPGREPLDAADMQLSVARTELLKVWE